MNKIQMDKTSVMLKTVPDFLKNNPEFLKKCKQEQSLLEKVASKNT